MTLGRGLLLFTLLLSLDAAAFADGGRLRLSEAAGPFLVTLFTTPEPLTPGPADFSVMVQDAKSSDILPGAHVTMKLTSPQHSGETVEATATHESATNKLLQAAEVNLRASGDWRLQMRVESGGQAASLATMITVEDGSRTAAVVWTFAVLPVVVLLLFSMHQRQKAFLARRHFRRAVDHSA